MSNLSYHCKWRIELAKQICEKVKIIEGVKAIVIGGSVARGYADEYSDLEIPIFWDKLPNENTRKLIVKELNAEYFYPYNYEANEDNVILQKNIFLILLALNKLYFPTFKWMYKSLETFKIKPENIEQRFRDIFTYPPKEAYENTLVIIMETLDIINEVYPELNTSVILSKLKSDRIPHDNPVNIWV
ncbi:nucleotidyltransferase domain-containing protein [Clostridium sp. AWRP]|uniref:nucleotidyltransferase domain-containing protein n=1 Tax=Clostridium sp. AWRP TaxID=2212991 RepID=UPI000FD82D75|nr:nucleotidyltransferase domain-containing protein [Clostridium sp. AWRP]AZV57400.1 nucleotidyltransferase domain-containing protein [Clostridium sp. AWRP]